MADKLTCMCSACEAIRDLDLEMIATIDENGNMGFHRPECIDGEFIRDATDWIRREIFGLGGGMEVESSRPGTPPMTKRMSPHRYIEITDH